MTRLGLLPHSWRLRPWLAQPVARTSFGHAPVIGCRDNLTRAPSKIALATSAQVFCLSYASGTDEESFLIRDRDTDHCPFPPLDKQATRTGPQ